MDMIVIVNGWIRIVTNMIAIADKRMTITINVIAIVRRDPIHILHVDDNGLILWHNNPKTAYATVYRW